jgi:hypothetical protein
MKIDELFSARPTNSQLKLRKYFKNANTIPKILKYLQKMLSYINDKLIILNMYFFCLRRWEKRGRQSCCQYQKTGTANLLWKVHFLMHDIHIFIYRNMNLSIWNMLLCIYYFFETSFELFRIYFRSGTEEETGSSFSL